MSDNGATPRVRLEFLRAVHNSVQHAKRGLLDFLDYQWELTPPAQKADQNVRSMFEFLKKRIHNDVSMVESQVLAAFEIYTNGGTIPPFGRTEEEREHRSQQVGPAAGHRSP